MKLKEKLNSSLCLSEEVRRLFYSLSNKSCVPVNLQGKLLPTQNIVSSYEGLNRFMGLHWRGILLRRSLLFSIYSFAKLK